MLNLIEDHGKVAVIDIGSNSLRFVIFDRYGRYPYPLFNERITCRLGDGVQKTKKLNPSQIEKKTSPRHPKSKNNIAPPRQKERVGAPWGPRGPPSLVWLVF